MPNINSKNLGNSRKKTPWLLLFFRCFGQAYFLSHFAQWCAKLIRRRSRPWKRCGSKAPGVQWENGHICSINQRFPFIKPCLIHPYFWGWGVALGGVGWLAMIVFVNWWTNFSFSHNLFLWFVLVRSYWCLMFGDSLSYYQGNAWKGSLPIWTMPIE